MVVDISQAPILEIAHVLFVDIVAYSTLPVESQRRAVRTLQGAIASTKDYSRFRQDEQLIVIPTGDGIALVFFRDIEAPVRCALELAGLLQAGPQVRMGVHTGPVYRIADINANRNVAGGGINMAQRVMDVGDAGHILVSKSVAEVLAELSTWREHLHALGEAEVKHGVQVHLFNLYIGSVGNPNIPGRLSSSDNRIPVKKPTEPRASSSNLSPGVKISYYDIICRLGGGGMGVVYEAEDLRLERRVALKFFPEHLLADQQAVERFQREARAASALNHPHICTVHDIGVHDGLYYIAMELLEGATLKAIVGQRSASVKQVVRWGEQITDALESAHAKGIVHRDLKPANIFVTRRDQVKLLDFGVAKITLAGAGAMQKIETDLTAPGAQLGTIAYMSPEQARGQVVDSRSDLFSVGMVLYEVLTGKSPFPGDTPAIIFDRILNREAPDISELMPEVPAALRDILDRALRKDREQRYSSASEMRADLQALHALLSADSGTQATMQLEATRGRQYRAEEKPSGGAAVVYKAEDSDLQRLKHDTDSTPLVVAQPVAAKAPAYSKFRMIVAACVLPTAMAGAVVWYSRSVRTAQIDSIAVLPFTNRGGNTKTDYLSDGITESLIDNLTRVPDLKVKSRSSIFRYKSKDVDVQQVGKDLGVAALVSGWVAPRGDTIELSAELTDLRDNTEIWGQHYSSRTADIISLQQQIAGDIADKLRSRLNSSQKQRVTKQGTENPQAYELYLKGRYEWNKRTLAGLTSAISYFNEAIAKDPSYALAYLGLADAYGILPFYGGPPGENYPKSNAAARKALELDPTLARAHADLGSSEIEYELDFAGGEAEYKKALELDPNDATVHAWHAINMGALGRFHEALAEIARAHQLDPLSPIIGATPALIYKDARQFDDATSYVTNSAKEIQKVPIVHQNLALAYWAKRMYPQVIEEWKIFGQLSGNSDESAFASALEQGFRSGGWKAALAKGIEARLAQRQNSYASPYEIATLYADMGNNDEAFHWLETAYREREGVHLILLKTDFLLDPIRSDARFDALVRKIGLP